MGFTFSCVSVLVLQSCLFFATPSTRLLCQWNSPSKNTGVGCHSLLQGIFQTQRWNPGLHCRQILYCLDTRFFFFFGLIPGFPSSASLFQIPLHIIHCGTNQSFFLTIQKTYLKAISYQASNFQNAVCGYPVVPALLSGRLQIRNNYHSNSEMLFPFFIILIFINTLMMNKQCVKLVEAQHQSKQCQQIPLVVAL